MLKLEEFYIGFGNGSTMGDIWGGTRFFERFVRIWFSPAGVGIPFEYNGRCHRLVFMIGAGESRSDEALTRNAIDHQS